MPTFNNQPIKISYSAILLTSNGSILTGLHFLNMYISPQFSEGKSHLRMGCNFTEYSIIKKNAHQTTSYADDGSCSFPLGGGSSGPQQHGAAHQKQRQGKS